ncbi:MAG: hypothetical protein IKX34_00615 [Bacteroidales bacterium]|nr:hypothetical protein [Bacteroidales bacterium]
MKRLLLSIPAMALLFLFTAGCGSLGNLSNSLGNLGIGGRTYTFNSLPQTLEDLKALPEASLTDPYAVAALTVAALTRYGTSSRDCMQMLNFLKGPEPVSNYESQFIRERLQGKEYKPFSFFKGATPANNYTPSRPYKITVDSNPYSFTTDGSGHEWCTLYVTSGGADSPRPIKLRKKASTGQWFLNDIQCLSDIRTPAAADPWN